MQHTDKLFNEVRDYKYLIQFWQSLSSSEVGWVINFKNVFKNYLAVISDPSKKSIREQTKTLIKQQILLEQFNTTDLLFNKFLNNLVDDISKNDGAKFKDFIKEIVDGGSIDIITMLDNHTTHKITKQEIPMIKTGLSLTDTAAEKKAVSNNISDDDPIAIGNDLYNLGYQQLTKRDYSSAVKSFELAISFFHEHLSVKSIDTHLQLATCYRLLSNKDMQLKQNKIGEKKLDLFVKSQAHITDELQNKINILTATSQAHNLMIIHSQALSLFKNREFKEAAIHFESAIRSFNATNLQYSTEKAFCSYLLANSWTYLALISAESLAENYLLINTIADNLKNATGYLVAFPVTPNYKKPYNTLISKMLLLIENISSIEKIHWNKSNTTKPELCCKTSWELFELLISKIKLIANREPDLFIRQSLTCFIIRENLINANLKMRNTSKAAEQLKECRQLITALLKNKNTPRIRLSYLLHWENKFEDISSDIMKLPSSAKLFSDKTSVSLSQKSEKLINEFKLDPKDISGLNDTDIDKIYRLKYYLENDIANKEPKLSIKEIVALNDQQTHNLVTGYPYLLPFVKNNNKPLLNIDQVRNLSEEQRQLILIQENEEACIQSYTKLCSTFIIDLPSDRKLNS